MGLRCLIVDDSEEFLASAARLLESQGVDVVGVATGYDDALRMAEDLAPGLALVDVELGDEDGIALAGELKARMPAMRVILISAHELDDLGPTELGTDAPFLPKGELGADAIAVLLD